MTTGWSSRTVRGVPDLASRRRARALQRGRDGGADRLAGAHGDQALREHQEPLHPFRPPGLRGPRALEELARLAMSAGMLAADDLRRLPPTAAWRRLPG